MKQTEMFGTSANFIIKNIRTFGNNQEALCDAIQLYDIVEHKVPDNIVISKNISASKIVEYLKATNEINLINEDINTDSLYKFLQCYLG